MRTLAVIPARYASTRLPGKPLLEICGMPMIQRVYELVNQAVLVNEILVATDDIRIARTVENFGGLAVMTSPLCVSGTDRLVEIAHQWEADIFVNIQCDEPMLVPSYVDNLIEVLQEHPHMMAATPCYPISYEQAKNPNIVKIVRSNSGAALYFSRAIIPFDRDNEGKIQYWGHMGMYAYRHDALKLFSAHDASTLERTEKLEQLRLLQNGGNIQTMEIPYCTISVDTPEDLEYVRTIIGNKLLQRKYTPTSLLSDLAHVHLVITDVDGVLTDGGLYYGSDGECFKRFCVYDGLGIKMLQKVGIRVAVLSGRDDPALRRRLADMDISLFRLGVTDKHTACESLLQEAGISRDETLYIGDDLPDLEAFACCAFRVAVANARYEVKQAADMVLDTCGGHGAFRELADSLLNSRQHLTTVIME